MKSPVLFIIFKREDTTRRVFERIREAQPPRLYIAADGPRKDRSDEIEKCKATRKIVENIDWPCEVHKLFREENLGCGKGVSSAITWFFEHEEQGIIIEDDVLPHIDFFRYCDEMLDRYKNDERIQLISGSNWFYNRYEADTSYYLSVFCHIWGWATWRRVWNTYEYDVNKLDENVIISRLNDRFTKDYANDIYEIYKKMKDNQIDTWDYQFEINMCYFGRYSILPFTNMVENIGMGGEDASHTTSYNYVISNHHAYSPYPLKHSEELTRNDKADIVSYKYKELKPLSIRIINKIHRLMRKLFL